MLIGSRFLTVLAIVIGLLSITRVAQADDPLIVLFTENLPPYNMALDDKNFAKGEAIDGICTDIVREMFSRAGVKYDLSLRFPWERMYNLVLEKPNYGIFSTARTPEREKNFKWVGPLASNSWVVMGTAYKPVTIKNLDDLKKFRVGAYENDAKSTFLETHGIKPVYALKDQENARRLIEGQIDVWVTSDPAGRYLAKQIGVKGLRKLYFIKQSDLYLALNKETPDEVIAKLQGALESMRAEGVVDDLQKNYL